MRQLIKCFISGIVVWFFSWLPFICLQGTINYFIAVGKTTGWEAALFAFLGAIGVVAFILIIALEGFLYYAFIGEDSENDRDIL